METFTKHLPSPNDLNIVHNKNKYNIENVKISSILSSNQFENSNISSNFNKFDPQTESHQQKILNEKLNKNNSNTHISRHSVPSSQAPEV